MSVLGYRRKLDVTRSRCDKRMSYFVQYSEGIIHMRIMMMMVVVVVVMFLGIL